MKRRTLGHALSQSRLLQDRRDLYLLISFFYNLSIPHYLTKVDTWGHDPWGVENEPQPCSMSPATCSMFIDIYIFVS